MHRSRLAVVLPLAVALSLGLSGCIADATAEPSPANTSSSGPSTTATPTPAAAVATTSAGIPTPAATPTAAADAPSSDAVLTVGLSSASMAAGPTLKYSLSDLAAWTAAMGAAPSQSPLEGPPGYDFQMTALEWPGMKIIVPNDGSTEGGGVFVSAPTVAGHPVVTSQGIGVGSTRAEAIAAGAVDGFDSSELRFDVRDVAGTQSLQRPGEVGREYVMLILDGDSVVSLHLPANDFSDL